MVGSADVGFPGSSGIGKGPKKLRGGQLQFGHAPAGAGTSTKVPNFGNHSVDVGVTDRSDCWMDGIYRQLSITTYGAGNPGRLTGLTHCRTAL